MAIDKLLQKIHQQLTELEGALDPLRHETVQPSAEDCESALRRMYLLCEHIAVYKHHKLNNEISPSFNIHARISEKHIPPENEVKNSSAHHHEQSPQGHKNDPQEEISRGKTIAPLSIGLNDKFRFINELFSQNASEYHIVFEQLSTLGNWSDTEIYLQSLRNVYGWKENSEVVKYFYGLLKRRFE